MAKSLKERREDKRLQLLREQIRIIDRQVLLEHKAATLLLEAMDEKDLQTVTAIVQKLNSVKTPQLPNLTKAIEQAQAELNKYTAGGPITKAWTKLKKLVGVDNPIVKIAVFANALERGFSQIPTILKNNGIDLQNADLSKSLTDTLAGSQTAGTTASTTSTSGAVDTSSTTSQNEADGVNVPDKLKNIVDQLRKALSPGGIYGTFKKVPYVSSQALAQELVQAPINVFSQVAKKIQSGAKAADIAPDMKAQIIGQGEVQTKHGNTTDPTKPSVQSQPTAPSKPGTVTSTTSPTGERPPQPPGTQRGGGAEVKDHKQKTFARLKDAGIFKKVGLTDAAAEALLNSLDDIGALKSPE
jgi:hypothetical protein